MMSVGTDAAGWTVVRPEGDSRVIYVSNSRGNDANSGLSQSAPVKSLAKASSLLRNKTGDQMLLLRGDTWRESLGLWTKSGRSASEPIVIGAYGTSDKRPTLATGASTAFSAGKTSVPNVSHVAILGLRFYADTRDKGASTYRSTAGSPGVSFTAATDGFLIEGCEIDGYTNNITLHKYFGAIRNFTIRRSVITDAYKPNDFSHGFWATGVDGLKLEENVFDRNGWNPAVPGAHKTMYNHNVYMKDTLSGVVVRGNVISNGSSHGLQARSGGIIENNTFINNPIHLSFGHVNGSPVKPGGVTGSVRNNVFLGGGDIGSLPRGLGIELGNIKPYSGATVEGNVFAHNPTASGSAINLLYGSGVSNVSQAVGLNDLTVRGNVVYNWFKAFSIMDGLQPGGTGAKGLNRLRVSGNAFQRLSHRTVLWAGSTFNPTHEVFTGNRYHSAAGVANVGMVGKTVPWTVWSVGRETGGQATQVSYSNPNRNAGSYAGGLGLSASDAGFVAAARAQSPTNWRYSLSGKALADYVRDGFDL
jgi:hypothetical protein